jgi:hypothetical protein
MSAIKETKKPTTFLVRNPNAERTNARIAAKAWLPSKDKNNP